MATGITDDVAARVMGEMYALTTRIDGLVLALGQTATQMDTSATAIVNTTQRVMAEVIGTSKELHEANTLPIISRLDSKLKEQIHALDRTASAVKLAGEAMKSDARLAVNNAREAMRIVIGEGKADAAAALQEQAAAMMASAAGMNKVRALAFAGGIVAVIVLLAVTAGYVVGVDAGGAAGYAKARDESLAAAWANTAAGKTAYSLVKSGMLDDLTHCAGKGWKAEGGILCTPYPDTKSDTEKLTFFGMRMKK